MENSPKMKILQCIQNDVVFNFNDIIIIVCCALNIESFQCLAIHEFDWCWMGMTELLYFLINSHVTLNGARSSVFNFCRFSLLHKDLTVFQIIMRIDVTKSLQQSSLPLWL